jgi:hypothetical protein
MKTTPANSPTHAEISARAHAIWEQEGRPEGKRAEHWHQAERELREAIHQAPGVGSPSGDPRVPHGNGRADASARGANDRSSARRN